MRARVSVELVTVLVLAGTLSAATQIPLPPFSQTYSAAQTRGFWFTAPANFTITGLRVPDETGAGTQSVQVFLLAGPPPSFPATASVGSVYYIALQPSSQILAVNIPVTQGQVVAVLGACGSGTMRNSYGAGQFASSVAGQPVTLVRFGTQNPISSGPAPNYWQEPAGSIARVEIYYEQGPSCSINAPAPMASVSGHVTIDHDVDHASGTPVDATYEWSTDAGTTWNPCTASPGSSNPALGIPTPSTGVIFEWDSFADGIGLVAPVTADVRITVFDGVNSGTCSVAGLMVDNVLPSPTCTLALQGGSPVSLVASFDLLPDSLNVPAVDATLEYSTDSGTSWLLATAASGTNPRMGLPIGVNEVFPWDTDADAVGQASPAVGVLLRATIDDGAAPFPGECTTAPFDVDNTALCQGICGDCNLDGAGPGIIDALVIAQISATLIVPSGAQIGCCDVNSDTRIDIIDALYVAQSSAGLAISLVCP